MKTKNKTTQTIESSNAIEQRFNSISDIVEDPYFIKFVKQNINELKDNRAKRPAPKEGYHYKRDWYDRMSGERSLNSEFFIKNIESIWLKRSDLSSQIRNVVQFVCEKSYQQALNEYSKIDK